MERTTIHEGRLTTLGLRTNQKSFFLSDSFAFVEQQTLFSTRERDRKGARKTGIICTIGPASCHVHTLEKMIAAGMNIARLNMAHSSYDELARFISNIRTAVHCYSMRTGANISIGIALETRGSQVRTGKLDNDLDEITLQKDSKVTITINPEFKYKCDANTIYINKDSVKKMNQQSEIILDEQIHLRIHSIREKEISCTVLNSGSLGNWKKVCFPGEGDEDSQNEEIEEKKDIEFAMSQDIDIIFLSCVKSGESIFKIRKFLDDKGKHIALIAKLRSMTALKNVKEIIHESDGIMVAREELGVMFRVEKVFVAHKNIMMYCVRMGKPVICASVMLRSMVKCPRATQAESSDIANVVLDGVDCVVLSGETAIGNFPLESLRTMVKICNEAEDLAKQRAFNLDLLFPMVDPLNTLALTAIDSALKCMANAIMVISRSGRSAHMIAKYRPSCLLVMITRQPHTANQAHLYRCIIPILCDTPCHEDPRKDIDVQVQFGMIQCKKRRMLAPGNQIVIIIGKQMDTSVMHTVRIEDIV